MVRELTKIVYRPSPEVNEDYILIVNPEEVGNPFASVFGGKRANGCRFSSQYKRWKAGGTCIAPGEVELPLTWVRRDVIRARSLSARGLVTD